ncbi:MAG: hypothetical protein ABW352_13720 [Polyangiales bacterium]
MDRRLLPFALALLACNDVPQDDFVSQGGISPDPTAILEGSVLYTGPPPRCVYENGVAQRVLGRVALTMFEYDNPPPPEGSASSALNLMFVEGLFSTRDCLPDGVTTSDQRLTRSVAFRWPRVTLGPAAASYQIRGFYDYDEDMLPLFSVSRLPTAGDVIGAAVNDVRDPSKGLLRIALPRVEEAEDGLIYGGITVALAEVVRTERPAFQLDANRTLSSAQPFIPALGAMGLDAAGSLRGFRSNTCATPGTAGCGLSLSPLPASLSPLLAASGVAIDLADPIASAFYSAPIDIKTVNRKSDTNSGVDTPVPDGKVDPHPILGAALGIPWFTPAVLLQRLPSPGAELREAAARIPRVLFVGTPLLNDDLTPIASSFVEAAIPVAVPPVAAVELITGRSECRVPYFAPGTPSLVTNGRLSHCAPLPSGRYAVNVLAGVAGGVQAPSTSGESPATFTGARYSGQSWTLPNELGNPLQTNSVVAGQGLDDTFLVQDAPVAQCAASMPNGLCAEGLEIIETADGVDSVACLRRECCEYVAHLCGVPACPKEPTANGGTIAASPTSITATHANGGGIPNCVPFEMPTQCCPVAAPAP